MLKSVQIIEFIDGQKCPVLRQSVTLLNPTLNIVRKLVLEIKKLETINMNWVHLQVISQLLLIRIYFVLIMFIIENILDHHSKDVNMNLLFSRCAYQTMMNHQFENTRILSEKS
jgi:hypothetical protein